MAVFYRTILGLFFPTGDRRHQVSVRGSLAIDRTAQIESFDNRLGAEIEIFVDDRSEISSFFVERFTMTGSARPIAYATETSTFFPKPCATKFLATKRHMYAAERSTFIGSLPEKHPPPCGIRPP